MMVARKTKSRSTRKPAKRGAGRTVALSKRSRIRGTYDAASDSVDNRKHWENADSLAANVLNDPGTRQRLRDRARFEVRNNCHAYGLAESLSNDLVGTGPRLQLTLPDIDLSTAPKTKEWYRAAKSSRDLARFIETAWANWCRAIDLAEDLRLLHRTRVRDGEAFALLIDNDRLPASGLTPLTLDIALYEAEQVADPFYWRHGLDPTYDDGIRRDRAGNAIEYTFLKTHPGGNAGWLALDTEVFPASRVLHWFKPDRPGQSRGISTITPGLNLFAQLRRYGLAVLGAAELAAMLAGVMKSTQAPADGSPVEVATMDEVELARNALLTLPPGWDAVQFDPKQPAPSFKEFRTEVLNEIGRSAQVPRNVMTGSSAEYNYSSARADFLLYYRTINVERSRMRARVIDPLFLAWVQEAALAGAIPPALPPISTWQWEWQWDAFDSVDPEKDAKTDEIELRIGSTTLKDIYARKGQDVEEKLRERAREQEWLNDYGLTAAQALVTPGSVSTGNGDDDDGNSGAASKAAAAGGVQATALNGAQIQSLLMLADKVVLKQYPADAAELILQAAFPLMSKPLIQKFVASLSRYEPAPMPDQAVAV